MAKRRRPPAAAKPDRPKVAVAYVHPDDYTHTFAASLTALYDFDRAALGLLRPDSGRISVRCGTDGLVAARNTVARQVVDSDVDWLLWIDTDMGFEPDALYRLLSVADPVQRPIVGALCFASRQVAHDGAHGFRTRPLPTIYQWVEMDGEPRFVSSPIYPVNELVRCAATGSAFVLIHRSVFERIGKDWYVRLPAQDGNMLGEDVSFCVRVGALDIPVWVHTGVRTTHRKPQWVGETDHWRAYVAPPAKDPTAVLMPDGAPLDFVRTLQASTGLTRVVGSADEATEPWVLLTAPEARFKPGWLDHAQHVAETFAAQVVGVNDLTPEAVAGETTSTILVAREYLAEADALDIPAIIEDAKKRGLWQMALGAVVEREVANG